MSIAEQADKIKAMMAGFTLPMCQQPSWARLVPEDQWKAQLLSTLKTQDDKSQDLQSQLKENQGATSTSSKAQIETPKGAESQPNTWSRD